jgi:Ca-activated chloride channel family protein
MSRPVRWLFGLLLCLGMLAPAAPALADGIIIPQPPICGGELCPGPFPVSQLAIRYHRVEVTIQDQVATTRVDQVFRNDNNFTVEGTYMFPLPPGATVTQFTLWVDGKPVEGKVLTREQARQTYEDIVRSLRDPALLEYVDRGAVQASIFPIEPGAERRIQLEYTQVLEAEDGLVHYRYPLDTEKFSTQPLEEVTIRVDVEGRDPIQAIYSPSHEVDIVRDGEQGFEASYEAANVLPDRDFELYYSLGEDRIGLHVLSYREPGEDGFFLLLASPAFGAELKSTVAKDVLAVIDRSGSMDGEKIEQAKQAAIYVLQHLHPGDRFNLLTFSSSLDSYASSLREAGDAPEAIRWVEALSARGSTDINRALLEAAAQLDAKRPALVLFLTDGLPTEGVTDREAILENMARSAPASLRLFSFGVGYDVDSVLLDTLSEAHHGATTYVLPGQNIDETVSAFYAKVSTPVLTDLDLDLGDSRAYDLIPETLPDLFAGGQLVVVGRYRNPGDSTVELSGRVGDRSESFRYSDIAFARSGGPDFLPRLWATRKVGALLNDLRLHGADQETVDQVVRLSIQYGIVTPYTSYLVAEPHAFGADAIGEISQDAFKALQTAPSPASGQAAVERAAAESQMGGADIAPAQEGEAAQVVRTAGTRTFRLVDGVWTDTTFDPQATGPRRVPFLSADYFALAASRPDVAAALALGERVIIVVGGIAYETVGANEAGDAIRVPDPVSSSDPALPDEPDLPSVRNPGAEPIGVTLPCAGGAIALGACVLPLRERLGRRAH